MGYARGGGAMRYGGARAGIPVWSGCGGRVASSSGPRTGNLRLRAFRLAIYFLRFATPEASPVWSRATPCRRPRRGRRRSRHQNKVGARSPAARAACAFARRFRAVCATASAGCHRLMPALCRSRCPLPTARTATCRRCRCVVCLVSCSQKPQIPRRPDEDATGTSSDSTVVGTDESESESGKSSSKTDDSFTLVKGKNKNQVRKAQKKSKLEHSSPVPVMEVAMPEKATSATPETMIVDPSPGPITTSTQVETERVAHAGAKPSAPPKGRSPSTCSKEQISVCISADCTRLRINYTKAVRVAEDGIRITCPDVQTFRSLNKYLIDSKVKFHTYALEEERKLKAVIRGIPADFDTNDIKTDLLNQGFPVQSVHRLCRRDGSPLWLVLAVLPRTEEARSIFANLSKVCGLSGIRVEAPRNRGGPGQCHRCQRYGHAAANCHADPRCVKCLVPHWTKECPRTRDSGEKPECVNCGLQHTANYRGCPKAPKFAPPKQKRSINNRPSRASEGLIRNDANFPELRAKPSRDAPAAFRPAPAPPTNPWTTRTAQPPSATSRPLREAQRSPPVPPPVTATAGSSSFGDDIQTVMAVLRAVSSSEIAEFANQLRACRNVEEKLLVLVRWTPQTENITLLSLNANGLSNNILELTKCYVQLRTDRTHASRGTALYYSRSLHCCPIDIPPLINMEATGCRLAMTGHRTHHSLRLFTVSKTVAPARP
ncbi:Nucleic-acid-binding protein from transposon X-element [Eumeta japonica]|uniref:Nucleic-acid-binding protein from transposon X-element n=1 Tax=Eumeta variegata TaxID=151549 RepID=A0A4C1SN78_EUMVA|nr:Nucleic-acid-binding protein from transposon X-element [Eumeta japonica]